ncbi:MAG: heavy-metal-associated domain-containing protein [Bacilli bacterium]|nr:heavy-metal-associated domain-containing protein [Mollicutes bacterium]MDY3899920.1 heavy-metal-associated domain-containing protein [Bacilli bacterium]
MKKVITIEGMHCDHCAQKVTSSLEQIDGIKKVKVHLKKKQATVVLEHDVDNNDITSVVKNAGFEVIEIK